MTQVQAMQGDITKSKVDVIVNAANSSLLGGGGVDGAIHRAGGPAILEECRAIADRQGGCDTGEAVLTTAGLLPARHVIHTVGPVWGQMPEHEAVTLLASCYRNSLTLAAAAAAHSIAFPNISTGAYRFPNELAGQTAVDTVLDWVETHPDALESVSFVCFETQNQQIYQTLLGLR